MKDKKKTNNTGYPKGYSVKSHVFHVGLVLALLASNWQITRVQMREFQGSPF